MPVESVTTPKFVTIHIITDFLEKEKKFLLQIEIGKILLIWYNEIMYKFWQKTIQVLSVLILIATREFDSLNDTKVL